MKEQIERQPSNSIQINETLGREERSRSSARRTYRSLKTNGAARVPVSKFMPPKGTNDISVNRMDLAPAATLAEFGARNASQYGKMFWGWYSLTVSEIKEVGCCVKASPFVGNPYHADIVMPVALDAEDRKGALIECAMDLAYRAKYLPWGNWINEIA